MSGPVDTATNTISENLTESWTDWGVSHGDLIENNQVMAGLSPQERNQVIARLSDDQLGKWADEIDGSLGSLSQGERRDLFTSLASGLDETQLTRVVRAFDGQDASQQDLLAAIATHAPPSVHQGVVSAVAGDGIQELLASLPPGPLSAQEYQELAVEYVRAKVPGSDFNNIYARNEAITATYAEMYLSDPETYKWAGMAAFASDLVGDGIRQAEAGRQAPIPIVPGVFDFSFTGLSHSLQLGNAAVYTDIFWQHLAYEHGGLPAIEQAFADGAITERSVVDAWTQIDEGRRTGNAELVWAGNQGLLRYEQEITLQQGVYDGNRRTYQQLSSGLVGLVQPLTSPIPGDPVSFQDHVPGGDVGDFNDRWAWISESMLPAWQSRELDVREQLIQLAMAR